MVTTSQVSSLIDTDLHLLSREVAYLPELARDWASDTAESRDAFYLEWRSLMGTLTMVDRAYRVGDMSAEQQKCYRTLQRNLADALPIIERLGLNAPAVPLDD
jgi:hypothetical protein